MDQRGRGKVTYTGQEGYIKGDDIAQTIILRKILDGDFTKITKMSRKIDQHGAIAKTE